VGKKRVTFFSTFSSRKPKISGLLLSIVGVNTPVCHAFTATTAFWMKGSSFENRKKSALRAPGSHAGLNTSRSTSSALVLRRACTWYLRSWRTRKSVLLEILADNAFVDG
jgi:hypothetical protein